MRGRLLYLSQTLPYPPDSGVKIRAYHTLRILAREYDVTALCFYRRQQTAPGGEGLALSALGEFGAVEAFEIPQEWSRLRWMRDHTASVLQGRPYTDFVFSSGAFSRRIDELLAERGFDLVHFESSSVTGAASRMRGLPKVCVHHNVESQLLARRASVAPNPLVGSYLRFQARRLRALERRVCPAMDLNITVSEEDADTFRAIAPDAEYLAIPNGVDTEAFRPADGPTSGIVLLGGTDWFPNLDGLEYFAREILPRIRERMPGVRATSVGRASDEEIQRFALVYDVELTGYVEDIRPYVHAARCVAVPLRVGGGSRLKILDSWAMGKAVVSTVTGCEGLEAEDGRNALVRDDAAGFAEAVLRLLDDEATADRLGRAARTLALERYSWDAIAPRMLEAYRAKCPGGGKSASAP